MATLNPSSDIASYITSIYDDAMLVARDNNLMLRLVQGFNDRSGTADRKNSDYGTAIINSVGETDDLAGQEFKPTVLSTLTPGEVGAQFNLTDTRLETDLFPVRADAAMELGMAMAQKIESDLLGNFSSLTGGTVGTAGSTISWGYFFAMMSRMRQQLAPRPWFFVCHPYQWHSLGKAVAPGATVTNAPQFQDAVARNFFVGSVSGVDIYTSANISVDASDDAYCAMFSRPAIAYDQRRAPRLEPERDASRRLWELNLTALYAHGVWRPTYGVQGIFDATAPTS